MKIRLKANPDFIKNAPVKARKRWADALVRAEKNGIKQANRMFISDDSGVSMCCLMVGHEEFGGTDDTRNNIYPYHTSPFTLAMKRTASNNNNRKNYNPDIAINLNPDAFGGKAVRADDLNDKYKVPFSDIAKLIYSPTGNYPTIEVDYTPNM